MDDRMMDGQSATERISGFFKRNLLMIILFATTIAYLFLDYFELNVNIDWSWYKVVGVFTINFGFGYAITEMMADEGLKAGQESPKYLKALKTYGDEKVKTDGFSELASSFCEYYNEREHEQAMRDYFMSFNLRYDIVKANGYDPKTLTKSQSKAIRLADKRVRILNVTPKYMFSLSNKPYRNKKSAEDIPTHEAKRKIAKIANKVIFGVCFTVIAWQIVVDPSWSNFLSSLIKVVTWLIFGGITYFQEYQFVTEQYIPNFIIDKTDLLVEFRNRYEKGEIHDHTPKAEANDESATTALSVDCVER